MKVLLIFIELKLKCAELAVLANVVVINEQMDG